MAAKHVRQACAGLMMMLALAALAAPAMASGGFQQEQGNPIPPPAMGQPVDGWIPLVLLLIVLAVGFLMKTTAGSKS